MDLIVSSRSNPPISLGSKDFEALHLCDHDRTILTDLVDKIEQEYNQNIDKHTQKLIVNKIELILDYSKRYYDPKLYTHRLK